MKWYAVSPTVWNKSIHFLVVDGVNDRYDLRLTPVDLDDINLQTMPTHLLPASCCTAWCDCVGMACKFCSLIIHKTKVSSYEQQNNYQRGVLHGRNWWCTCIQHDSCNPIFVIGISWLGSLGSNDNVSKSLVFKPTCMLSVLMVGESLYHICCYDSHKLYLSSVIRNCICLCTSTMLGLVLTTWLASAYVTSYRCPYTSGSSGALVTSRPLTYVASTCVAMFCFLAARS